MNPNTYVYCTNCINLNLKDGNCPHCIYENKCDIYNCEDSRPFKDRPYYIELINNKKEC